MINANELRIGNLVLYEHKTMIIDEINSDGTIEFDDSINKKRIMSIWPIIITEGILFRCGFNKNNLMFINDILPFVKIIKCIDYFDVIIGNVFYVKLHSLHQLQNLYFALTGQELAIEL